MKITYELLLEKTPQIAEAVNLFDDVRIQRAAFVVLMEALGVDVEDDLMTSANSDEES